MYMYSINSYQFFVTPFTQLEVLLPHSATVPDYIELLFSTPQSYYTAHLPLSHIIQPDIISKYIALGSISALSVGTRIDIDNVYCLLPTGTNILTNQKCYMTNGT